MTVLAREGYGQRARRAERLDAEGLDPGALEASLRQVERANRWFGGTRALKVHLESLFRWKAPIRVLDVGAGNGGVLADVVEWSRERGAPWHGVGVDHHPQVCRLAAEALAGREGVTMVRADGLRLPFPDGSFDAVLCTLTLHHFGDDEAVELLAEMERVSRGVVLVNDLHRHPVNHLLALFLSVTLWALDPITRHDGPLSVLRSFTPDELLSLGQAAGLTDAGVTRHPIYRLVLRGGPRSGRAA